MGGFDLPRAEAVAGPAADLGEDVLDGLASLVDQSLVRSDEVLGEPRFSMLEPIREYALERLEAAGSTDAVGERHARAYLALAEELAPALNGDGQRAALDRLELEHANLRAAIDWADARSNAEVALGITIAVWRMWQKRGYLREARIRVAALIACEWFAATRRRSCAPRPTRSWAGSSTGTERSTAPVPTTRRPSRSGGRSATGARSRTPATTSRSCSRWARSRSCHRTRASRPPRCWTRPSRPTDRWATSSARPTCSGASGPSTSSRATTPGRREAFESALALYRKLGDRTQEAWSLHMLGTARLRLGETDVARGQLAAGLQMFMSAGDVAGVTLGLDDLAAVAVGDGDLVRAARLSGLARRIQASSGTGLAGAVENVFELATKPDTGGVMSPEDLARYQAEGAALPINDGVRYALGEIEFEDLTTLREPA